MVDLRNRSLYSTARRLSNVRLRGPACDLLTRLHARHIDPMFGVPAFWNELKKRRVVRVAVVYLAVGWGVFEASETLTGVLDLPDVTPRLVLALVVLGFPLAVTLAWIYQRTATRLERDEAYSPEGRFNLPFIGGVAVGVLAVAGLGFAFFGTDRGAGPAVSGALDPEAVAVLPFRVSAPDDLSYLGGGVMDLLSARLDGAVGPSAVDPGAVVRAAEREGGEPRTVAIALGAGLVVTGSVVGSPSSVVVSAEYTDVRDGSLLASAEAEGHPDSLATLADRILVELLSLTSDEYTSSITALTSTSPDALKSYLRGKEAWRVGDYVASSAHFDEALVADSTFALAALWYVTASGMGYDTPSPGDKPALAWRHRDRLSARDLQYLEATTRRLARTGAERLAALERLTRDQPDRVEAWYQRGDALWHAGSMFPAAERMARAWSVWKRALELDPGYGPIFDHLLLWKGTGMSPEQKQEFIRAFRVYQKQPTYRLIPGFRISFDDDAETWALDFDLDAMGTNGLTLLKWFPVMDPDQARDGYVATVDALLRESRRRIGIDVTLSSTLNDEFSVNLALGRPGRAEEVREEAIGQGVRARLSRTTIYDALWGGVAHADAEASVAAIDMRLGTANDAPLSMTDARDLAAVEIWRHLEDSDYSDPASTERVRAAAAQAPRLDSLRFEAIALLLEGWGEVRGGGASPALDRLVEILDQGPGGAASGGSLLMAASRAFEEAGNAEMALETLDRGGWGWGGYATQLWREQGRLALAVGDTARAVREYRNWLKLRFDAEPSVMPDVEAVRAELARLGG